MSWWVYIIRCDDDSLYTGISTNVERRFADHAGESGRSRQAKYFYGRKPVKVLYRQSHEDRSNASRREAEIKKLTRAQKISLIESA